ncbi:MAG: hypothetical protein WEA58_12415 [Balneolaceae bacterium]
MKIILSLFLFIISLSFNNVSLYEVQNGLKLYEIHKNPCLPSHEKAEEDVKNYLAKERTIKDLTTKFGIEIDHISHKDVYALVNESDSAECQNLIDNFEWLVEESKFSYSIYKVADHYFIVQFQITENNKYKRNSISINNSELELIAVGIDIG